MQRFSLIASLLALTVAGTANAQARPASGTVVRPAVEPSVAKTIRPTSTTPTTLNSGAAPGVPVAVIAAGQYELGLHVQQRNGQPMNVVTIDDTVFVARSGSSMTVSGDSLSLTGSVSGAHFTAAGHQTAGTALSLSISGTASPTGSATGTFALQRGLSSSFTGTLTMSPVPVTAQAHDVVTRPPGGHGGGTTSCNLWCKIKNLLSP